ncbi:MAG TPA: polysaccharide biosynthesis tyrosine autokinase, partial [Longimicrobiales bacterium]|nr:polysaccharide biosynthesis tyrosine autokinase [Longimicrobiales bacterium]
AVAEPYGGEVYYPAEGEGGGFDPRRYLYALLRYKWLLVLATVLGAAGGFVAWRMGEVRYLARGNLWIEVERRQQNPGDVAPIRQSGLLEANAWIELLRSYTVLDSVVISERLYVEAPDDYTDAFRGLELDSDFQPGRYELRVGPDGASYSLVAREGPRDGIVLEEGRLGGAVGTKLGFRWTPPANAFPAGAVVAFRVLTPRDAADNLRSRLITAMAGNGNFLTVSLEGTNPERIASILNTLMDRHIKVAAELKRSQLDEMQAILERQLQYTEAELAQAERDLEEFRITAITLPSDRNAAIAPGLQITRDPVFNNFFGMRIELEQITRDRARLQEVAAGFSDGPIRIEALEVIPAAAGSSELRRILDELVQARSQLRAYRTRYADDYPPVQDLLAQIESIERRAIPQVVNGILDELAVQERNLRARIADASDELEAIPPRTIEEGRLERRVTIQGNLYNNLRGRVETARLAAASSIPDVRILDRAAVPREPVEDSRLRLALMIFFGCIGLAAGGAILLDRMDARFRYASDVSRDIGLDILGSIPRIQAASNRKGVLNAAQALEAFRELRIHLGFAYGSAGPITLTISSPSAGEGKSLIASNLAVAFAEVGRRTLLIDGDTRRGDAHKLLGLQQSPGLVDYLKERSGQEIIQKTEHANLDFIGCGSRGTSTPELLASSRMAYFVGTLKRSYDVIIVDTPPLAAGGDAVILSTLTGNLAVVIRTGTTEKQLAQAKLDQLSRLPVRILGAILNDVDPSDAYYYYYSAYLPGYEPMPEEEGEDGVQLISGEGERR